MTNRASDAGDCELRWIILLKRHNSVESRAWVMDHVEWVGIHEVLEFGETDIILPLLLPFIGDNESNPMVTLFTFIIHQRFIKAICGDDAAIDDVGFSEFYDSDVHYNLKIIQG